MLHKVHKSHIAKIYISNWIWHYFFMVRTHIYSTEIDNANINNENEK